MFQTMDCNRSLSEVEVLALRDNLTFCLTDLASEERNEGVTLPMGVVALCIALGVTILLAAAIACYVWRSRRGSMKPSSTLEPAADIECPAADTQPDSASSSEVMQIFPFANHSLRQAPKYNLRSLLRSNYSQSGRHLPSRF